MMRQASLVPFPRHDDGQDHPASQGTNQQMHELRIEIPGLKTEIPRQSDCDSAVECTGPAC
jgi:hypothetical protein